ncbi:hypothetical protein [Bacillus solitudinis]|uniref:hypothetical protein n=1 Tax=Bacillus solitudinis TaxID=2014074 RepID=UPI000C24572F|nr:hypothetical protein [Bacillus solitudinis]
MKKFVLVFFLTFSVFSLAGCGNEVPEEGEPIEEIEMEEENGQIEEVEIEEEDQIGDGEIIDE